MFYVSVAPCNNLYMDEIALTIVTRLQEHKAALKNQQVNSAADNHSLLTQLQRENTLMNGREAKICKRRIREWFNVGSISIEMFSNWKKVSIYTPETR